MSAFLPVVAGVTVMAVVVGIIIAGLDVRA